MLRDGNAGLGKERALNLDDLEDIQLHAEHGNSPIIHGCVQDREKQKRYVDDLQ